MTIPSEYWAFFIYEGPEDDMGFAVYVEPGFANENTHVKAAEKILRNMIVGTRGMLLNEKEEIVWEGEVMQQDENGFVIQGHYAGSNSVGH